jgi:hypothetical protein
MTPDRFRECLEILHWSQRGFGDNILQIGNREVRKWASGEAPVPVRIADTLERLAEFHTANPFPPPPTRGTDD